MEINLSKPDITEAERQAVLDVLASGRLSLGPYLERFENAVADYVNAKYAVAVSSGTAGLHLSLLVSGVKPGDHIITTPFSFVASANVILYVGARPVFVDVEPDTGNISPEAIEKKIKDEYVHCDGAWVCWKDGRRLRGILPVHVFGYPCRMDEITEIARKYNLMVIEDACEAMGSFYFSKSRNRWLHAGTIGMAGVFAFYPNKQITTGEGGVLVSDDGEIARLVRSLSNQGRDDMGTWLVHPRLGYNYRMDEMSAALGFVQMGRIEELRAKRRKVAALYNEFLKGIEEIEVPPEKPYAEVNPFVYVVKLRIPGRDELMNHLVSNGIGTRPYFTPIHLQPYYSERFGFRKGMFPVAESLGETCFALPFYNDLTEKEVSYVAERIKDWLSTKRTTIRRTKEDEKTKEAFETKPL